jgi:transposase
MLQLFSKVRGKTQKKSRLRKRTPGVHGWFNLLTSALLNTSGPTASYTALIMQQAASDETRAHIPVLRRQGYSVKDICHLLDIKKTLVYKVLAWHSQLGIILNPCIYSCTVGRPRILTPADLAFISAVIDHHPSIYLDELRDELQLKRNVHTTLPTLTHAVEQLGVTRKAISAHAAE